MKRFACWDAQDSYTVINPDADALDDYVFRAVHTDFPVQMSSGRANAGTASSSSREFLEAMLRPTDHAIVPVVGQSGTGKSHLIRWLNLQLRGRDDGREVIYVPKAQTNLRDIVHSLVNRLPKSEQAPYLAALTATGTTNLSSEAQRTAILNQLNLALVNDMGGADPEVDAELESYALIGLRSMFTDPHVRKTLLADGGFAAELAAHVFEKPENYSPADERREFRDRDLPLQVSHLQNAAHSTREFLGWLMSASDSDRRTVIDIVNRHVDWAIANCLNLSGDRLIKLMLDLRRHYRLINKELILLIEDFARLQGLDRPLLQSIIEQRSDLSILRTVFASTVGFYDSIASTIKTRITFIVDMDSQAPKDDAAFDRFVARYMNAIRWGAHALKNQWEEVQEGRVDFSIPSKCEECPHKGPCHMNFGAVDGMGLYPLTNRAILTMAERADANYRKTFNPRIFLRHVLRPIALAVDALANGLFPPPKLLTDLGGRQMAPAQQSELKRGDPQQWERRAALLELWGGTQEVRNLPLWLHEAFDLAPLRGAEQASKEEARNRKESRPPDVAEVDPRLAELQAWNERGETLKSATAQSFRDLVFEALREFVDWDNLGLASGPFVGNKGAFKAGHISFLKQATQAHPTGIRLQIPSNWEDKEERLRTTLALEGLLEARIQGDWSFANGIEKLASLLESLKVWSGQLINQCRKYDTFEDGTDGALAAFEARATLQALLNSSLDLTTDQEIMRVTFAETPTTPPPDFITADIAELVSAGRQVDTQLYDLVRTRLSATKGGVAGGFIDTARCLSTVRSLRRRRFMPATRSEGATADKRDLADPARQFIIRMAERLPDALKQEASARVAAIKSFREIFGDRMTLDSLLPLIQRVVDVAGRLQVPGTQALLVLKPQLDRVEFATAVTSLRAADVDKLDARVLRSGVGSVYRVLTDVCKAMTGLLDKTEIEITGRLAAAGVDPEDKARLAQEITTDLAAISASLARYQDANRT